MRLLILPSYLLLLMTWKSDGDIMNSYAAAPRQAKIWTILGPEFGNDQRKKVMIVCAL